MIMIYFLRKLFSTVLIVAILKVKFQGTEIVKTIFFQIVVFEDFLLIIKIGNGRVAENIFSEK